MRLRMTWTLFMAVALLFSTGMNTGAQSEIRVSTSTAPITEIDGRLAVLLGTERRALGDVGEDRLARLTAPPPPRGDRENTTTGEIEFSTRWLDSQPTASGEADWQCLSEALYFEARGESVRGQFAVAEVILNRVDSSVFPDSVCGVIHQGTGRRFQCQFTYTCDGNEEVVHEHQAYNRVARIARLMLDGAERSMTNGATYYHTTAVNPRWASTFRHTASIGVHRFYR